jgi:hypothetical protein
VLTGTQLVRTRAGRGPFYALVMPTVINLDELERRNRCRRRYGRATVTIRRWGGWGEFLVSPQLSKAIASFERGEATAEATCWAFVRARVESHSPTFDWRSVDRQRLLQLSRAARLRVGYADPGYSCDCCERTLERVFV